MAKRETKNFKDLTIKDDFMFGVIMRQPKYCKPFLECLLGVKIKKLSYPEPQKVFDFSVDGKSVRLDVYVEDDQGSIYDIEMQTTKNRNLAKRSRYYQGMIDIATVKKGDKYDKLRTSYVIFICNFDPFNQNRAVYHFQNYCEEDKSLALDDKSHKIFLNTKDWLSALTQDMIYILEYFETGEAKNAYTRSLSDAVQEVLDNEEMKVAYMTFQEKLNDQYEDGHEDGVIEERTRIAKKLLESGDEISKIVALTGFTEEEILKLKEKLVAKEGAPFTVSLFAQYPSAKIGKQKKLV